VGETDSRTNEGIEMTDNSFKDYDNWLNCRAPLGDKEEAQFTAEMLMYEERLGELYLEPVSSLLTYLGKFDEQIPDMDKIFVSEWGQLPHNVSKCLNSMISRLAYYQLEQEKADYERGAHLCPE
jgi:hypothetical protein